MRDESETRDSTTRRHLPALAFLALAATALFVLPLARQEVFVLRDHFDYFQPLRWFTASELQAGRLPLWNPYNASGEPWMANPQTGLFYPPAWMFVVLPFPAAYMLFLLFHLIVLGWSAYLLFARSASRGASVVGATALLLSGPVLSLLDLSGMLATLAWLPLALWCAREGAWRRGGIVLALAFLGGEPFFAAVAAMLYVVAGWRPAVAEAVAGCRLPVAGKVASSELRVARAFPFWRESPGNSQLATRNPPDQERERHGNRQPATGNGSATGNIKRLLLTALIAFGVSAIQLLPFLELVRGSDRVSGFDAATILNHSMRLRDWLRLAIPPAFGVAVDAQLGQRFIPIIYAGVLVCALALAGIRRRSAGWVALLVCVVAASTGPEWLTHLPLTLFRYPARLVPLGALAVAALAVAGYERIRGRRRWLDVLVLLLVIADLVPRVWPLLQSAPFRTDVVPYARRVGADSKILRVGDNDPSRRAAWISGYLNLYERRFDAFTAAPVISERYASMHRRLLEKPTREELAQKAIGWVVTTHDLAPAFTRETSAEGVTVYRNHLTLPMAALLVRNPLTMIPARVRFDTTHARVTVDAPREGVILLHQQDAPGWHATIDGVDARSTVRGELFRAVQITRGPHVIVWEYRPRSLRVGASITFLALLALTLSSFVKRAR